MREIRFRGMTTNLVENEFVYGYYQKLIGYGEYDLGNIYHFIVNENDESNYVDEKTVGQFTGLKDKNGVKIYEGDVLKCRTMEGKIMPFTVVWSFIRNGWLAENNDEIYDVLASNFFATKVIGNIHEVSE